MLRKIAKIIIPIFIFILTFIPRLYRIDNPVADWHSWRQADTAAVARNFVKDKFNLLYPQSDSFFANNGMNIPNPDRLFINEFPFYNAIVALLYKQFGIKEIIARLVSVVFASLGAVFLYLLVNRLFSQKIALTTSLFYALNPYNVYYGRVIMPDPTFVSLSIISLYFLVKWTKSQQWFDAFLFTIIFALAMLVKPYAIFMIFPMVYWLWINHHRKIFTNKQAYLMALGSLIPLALWRYHHYLHPEGIFGSKWLFNLNNIRFSGAFFRWLIFDRLNRLIFATGGFVLFIIGLLSSYTNKKRGLIFIWFLSVITYMTIFASGNVTHDYYQLPIVPVGSILVAFGFWQIINLSKKLFPKIINISLAVFLLLLSFAFGWYEVRGFFNINHPEIIAAGQAVDRLTPKDATVIAPYAKDPAFLYQTNRHGWPFAGGVKEKVYQQGITHYISTQNKDSQEVKQLKNACQIVQETDQYVLIDLRDCPL